MTGKTVANKLVSGKRVAAKDFSFSWAVNRYKDVDDDAVIAEAKKSGLYSRETPKAGSPEEKEYYEEFARLYAKHTSKHYTYSLYRRCDQDKAVMAALTKIQKEHGKQAYLKTLKSDGFKVYKDVLQAEGKKTRKFGSLATMQRWASAHGLNIDVYSLWEDAKARTAENATSKEAK